MAVFLSQHAEVPAAMGIDVSDLDLAGERLQEDIVRSRETIRSQLSTIEDLVEELGQVRGELEESRAVQRELQFELDARGRPGLTARVRDRTWAMLRWLWRRLPLAGERRDRFKTWFYACLLYTS